MSDIDDELLNILERIYNRKSGPITGLNEIKALFPVQGVCKVCDFNKKCRTLREYFHGESSDNYCSDFQPKESE